MVPCVDLAFKCSKSELVVGSEASEETFRPSRLAAAEVLSPITISSTFVVASFRRSSILRDLAMVTIESMAVEHVATRTPYLPEKRSMRNSEKEASSLGTVRSGDTQMKFAKSFRLRQWGVHLSGGPIMAMVLFIARP